MKRGEEAPRFSATWAEACHDELMQERVVEMVRVSSGGDES